MKLHLQYHTIIQYENKRGNVNFKEVVKMFVASLF